MYTTIKKVRDVTNNKLTREKIDDENMRNIILQAITKINSLINVDVREEEVKYLDSVRENNTNDGVTKKFYVKNGITNYLSDSNNDGEVTTSDVKVYKVNSSNIRSEMTVTAIDIEDGSFTLSEAPGTDTRHLYVWYSFSYYNVSTPDTLVQLLTTYLAASHAYLQKDHDLSNKSKFGNIEISRAQGSSAYLRFHNRYMDLLKNISTPLNKPRVGQYKHLI